MKAPPRFEWFDPGALLLVLVIGFGLLFAVFMWGEPSGDE